jgi:hypothetical protein
MRSFHRPVVAAIAAAALASCMDVFQGSAPGNARASLAIAPRFSEAASLASATLATAGVTYNSVRIVIVRPVSDTLKDTTIAFSPSSPEVTLELSIATAPGDSVEAGLQFKQDGTVIFSGTKKITAIAPTSSVTATPVEVLVDYTGPGASAASVTITPGAGLYSSVSNTQFTAKAFDNASAEIANPPIFWSVSDESKASISASGVLTPKAQRGTIEVTAAVPNGVAKQTIAVELAPAGASLRVVQGASQVGTPASTLPTPVVIQLFAADGLPAAGTGQTVTFVAPPGASINPLTTTLDANGRAQATMTLGPRAGSNYIYTATVGSFSVVWAGIAKAGTPKTFVTENGTSFTFKAGEVPTSSTMPRIRVADSLDNSVPGQFVRLTASRNGTQFAQGSVPVDSIGKADVYHSTLQAAMTFAGTYTILVESIGITPAVPSVTFTIVINPANAAKLVYTVQPSNVVQNATMTPAVKVEVRDQYENLVTSAVGNIGIAVDATTGAGVTQVGTGSEPVSGGVATFAGLKFSGVKTGVKITAAGFSLPVVLSSAFNITP